MSTKHRVVRWIAFVTGALLIAIGILHDVVNIRGLQRAAAKGDVAERLMPQLVANIASAGIALALPGLLLMLVAPGLAKGQRLARRIALGIGMFFVLGGIAGYLWQPMPAVFIFSALGALICVPLILWRADFSAD